MPVIEQHVRPAFAVQGMQRAVERSEALIAEVPAGPRPTAQPHYANLASHHRFAPMSCQPARGQEKSDAERTVHALQRRFATPVPRMADADELNRHLPGCCLRERDRTVSGRKQTIGQMFAFEQHATELPPRPFDCGLAHHRQADKYRTVLVDDVRYSVPRQVAFEPVTVRTYLDQVAIALGQSACRTGRCVKFTTAATLVNQLEEAQKQYRLERLLKQLEKIELLVIDELGYINFNRSGAELLFQVFADRHERGSILITSNLPFGEWGRIFQDERMTAALLDRFTHLCHTFQMDGESYRFRESAKHALAGAAAPMEKSQTSQ